MQNIFLPQAHQQTAHERAETLAVLCVYLNGLACEHHNDKDESIWQILTDCGVGLYRVEKHYQKEASK